MQTTNDLNPTTLSAPARAADRSLRERLLARVQAPSGVWVVVGIALLLTLPALAVGLSADDHVQLYEVRRGATPLSLFSITPERVALARDNGGLAWWSSPKLEVNFFRPLASLTHIVEYSRWPQAAWLMHLVNNLIYAAIVALAWFVFREILPQQPRLAALAALLFTIAGGHAATAGWISGRNTIMANMFSLSGLLLHVRARQRSDKGERAWLAHASSALCVVLALCSAEAGVSALAYPLAYALVFERGAVHKRIASLAPQLAVFAVWAVIYLEGHYGVRHTSFYRELNQPWIVLSQGLLDLPVWLFGLLGLSFIGGAVALPIETVRLVLLVLCLPLLAALWQATARSRENTFFALGSFFCLLPGFATMPHERLLMMASFGAFGILAGFIADAQTQTRMFWRGTRRVLIAFHVVLAPLLFVVALNPTAPLEHGTNELLAALSKPPRSQVIVLNAPIEILTLYVTARLDDPKTDTTAHVVQQLYAGDSAFEIERIDERTLEMRVADGWARLPYQRVFGAVADMPRAGEETQLKNLRIQVRESTADGRPKTVRFMFPTSLEADDRQWLVWRGTHAVPWQPPAQGKRERFEPQSMFATLEP